MRFPRCLRRPPPVPDWEDPGLSPRDCVGCKLLEGRITDLRERIGMLEGELLKCIEAKRVLSEPVAEDMRARRAEFEARMGAQTLVESCRAARVQRDRMCDLLSAAEAERDTARKEREQLWAALRAAVVALVYAGRKTLP